ncbi:MAG: ABC transporter permease [Anaerolineae bacterium]|nr:ABC transporter permease [Anaerolineae bacterium]
MAGATGAVWAGGLVNETHKRLLILWSYRLDLVLEIVWSAATVAGAILLFADESATRLESRSSILLGFILAQLGTGSLAAMSWGLRQEMTVGTLEQMVMGPLPVAWLVMGRIAANLCIGLAQMILMAVPLALILGISLPLRWAGLLPLVLLLAGIYGAGFMIGGLTLVVKRAEVVAALLVNLLPFFNGTIVGVQYFPVWLEPFARLMPTTQGLIVLRRVLLDGESLAGVWGDGSLPLLVVHSAGFLAAGVVIFGWCERIAKRRGTLGQY